MAAGLEQHGIVEVLHAQSLLLLAGAASGGSCRRQQEQQEQQEQHAKQAKQAEQQKLPHHMER